MQRRSLALLALLVFGAPASAPAAGKRTPAPPSTQLAAYTVVDGTKIHVTRCRIPREAARTVPNNACAHKFKVRASRLLCSRLGKGKHGWFYTVERDGDRWPAVALCL